MQCTWKQHLQLWSENSRIPDEDNMGEYCPPCWHHLQARLQQQNVEQNKCVHLQA